MRRLRHFVQWVLVVWVVVFWRLGYPSLLDPDEAHYAELTREMLRAKSWLVPLLDGTPFIDKPVLFHWLQAAAVQLFGETEFALRLPSTLAALLLIGMTRWMGEALFEEGTGEWAALMFATIPATFMLASVGLFDMVFSAFLFGGVACLLVAGTSGRKRVEYVGWALLTLAVMTKGPVALLLVGAFFVAAASVGSETRQLLRRIEWRAGLVFVIFAASPWFVWMWAKFGDDFVRRYLLAGNLWYMTNPSAFSTRTSSYAFYLRTFTGAFFPWSVVAIGWGIDRLSRWRDREPVPLGETLLWLWIGVVLVFFTIAGFKLDTYIFPAAPACCLLAAAAWKRAARDSSLRWTRAAVVSIAAVLMVGGVVLAISMIDVNLGLDWSAASLPAAMMLGGGWLLWQMASRQWIVPASLKAPLVTLLAAYGTIVMLGFPVLERSRPTAPLGRWIQRHSATDAPIAIYGLDDWRASLRYYADRQVTELKEETEVGRFLQEHPGSYVLMLRRNYDRFRNHGLDIKPVQRRPMIAGRSGKFIRRQIWDDLLIVAPRSSLLVDDAP